MGKLITVLLVLLGGCASATIRTVPLGYVVAPQRHVAASSYWSPTAPQIEEATDALADLFVRPPKSAKAHMKFPLADYVIRFHGDVIQGKRAIVGAGYHASQKSLTALEEEMADPRDTITDVFGGGALFFDFIYDTEAKHVLRFSFNAPK